MRKLFTFALMLVCSIGMYAVTGLSLYLVGDATPIGWEGDENMRQPCRMLEVIDGYYTWSGLLKHGGEGFKICKGGSWDGYHPSSEGFAMSSNTGNDYLFPHAPDKTFAKSTRGFAKHHTWICQNPHEDLANFTRGVGNNPTGGGGRPESNRQLTNQ